MSFSRAVSLNTAIFPPSGLNTCLRTQRPAVVISSSSYNAQRPDLILLAITSQLRASLLFGEALVADWQAAKLIKPSVFKPLVTTIEQSFVIKRLGRLSINDVASLDTLIKKIVG